MERGEGGRLENIRSGTSMRCEYKCSSIGPLRLAHWSRAFSESFGLAEETQRLRVVLSFDQGGEKMIVFLLLSSRPVELTLAEMSVYLNERSEQDVVAEIG